MADEGQREIQLNGKQLVFLFMASTVVAVVIFLCGVMVGRGVRAERASQVTEASVDALTDPTESTHPPAPVATSAPASSSNTPVASQERLTYPDRLEGQEPPDETFKRPVAPAASVAAPRSLGRTPVVPLSSPVKPAPAPSPRRLSAAPTNTALSQVPGEPAGKGFVVQVAAVNDRGEAETLARRLAGKGYPSFVTAPGSGTPQMFRVRIGKYSDRRQAESIATRLQREEQFKPWITR
jgi:cell division septation protein DedD